MDKSLTTGFTKILDGLRQHVPEVRMECTVKGVTMSNIDAGHIVAVSAFLDADWFKNYKCDGKTCFGFDLTRLYQILRVVTKANRVRIMNLEEDSGQRLEVEIQQLKGKRTSRFYLDNLEIDFDTDLNSTISRSLQDYRVRLLMPVADFKEIVDQMKIMRRDDVLIELRSNQLTFKLGEKSEGLIEYDIEGQPGDSAKILLGVQKIMQVGKLVTLADDVEININGDQYPVFFSFPITDACNVVIGLSPKVIGL